jgi:hypothetical protein
MKLHTSTLNVEVAHRSELLALANGTTLYHSPTDSNFNRVYIYGFKTPTNVELLYSSETVIKVAIIYVIGGCLALTKIVLRFVQYCSYVILKFRI